MNPDGTINWFLVFTTLMIRFIGVFIILGIIQIGISISSAVVLRLVAKKDSKPQSEIRNPR